MTSTEIRASFLDYFARHGHRVVASSPLVPADDPTLLFTNAGMNQFKDVFLGRDRREYRRAATSQKCMRVSGKHNDLENVGPSLRHHTFFEMLGNFSFGDYFKADAIPFAWTLLTEVWGLPADRLTATIFAGEPGVPRDDEAWAHWRRFVPAERIIELGSADNFWSMGDTGPCGRCSEIHYYRGDHVACPEPVCLGVACTCDRYVEVWNNVFMEFDRQPDGTLAPLPAPSIDTGMGLERVAAVIGGVLSNYDTDLFAPLLGAIGGLARVAYGGTMDRRDISMRVVADHARAMTFLIADGVVPSNEWRGYVLRKIMRRAMRHGKRLGMTEPFLYRLADVLVDQMGGAFPELRTQQAYIERLIRTEEERFESVLETGLPRLEDLIDRAAASGSGLLPGDDAFRLYDTWGVPRDFIEDLAGERHLALDAAGFESAMEEQRGKARARHGFGATRAEGLALSDDAASRLRDLGDRFEGYSTTTLDGVVVAAVFDEQGRAAAAVETGQRGYVALAAPPFYVESGGQVSDTGRLVADAAGAVAEVEGLTRVAPDQARLHLVRVTSGTIREHDIVRAEVDQPSRDATRRNHTATHLLHAALRQVLGTHVKQAGSLVSPDRLRFDFVHFAALSRDEIESVERIVNAGILRNAPVVTEVRSTDEAVAAGAMALFGEKYGDRVRVVSVPGVSIELCGGTHCRSTGDIGSFAIVQETGIAAGVRRIEAITGEAAVAQAQARRRVLDEVTRALNVPSDQAAAAIERLQAEAKRLAKESGQLKVKLAMAESASQAKGPGRADAAAGERVGGAAMYVDRVSGLDKAGLRSLADSHRDRLGTGVVVLASETDGKVALVVSVTRDLLDRLKAGQVVKEIAPIVGGSGGGRAEFAEAGGRSPEKIDEMLEAARRLIRRALAG